MGSGSARPTEIAARRGLGARGSSPVTTTISGHETAQAVVRHHGTTGAREYSASATRRTHDQRKAAACEPPSCTPPTTYVWRACPSPAKEPTDALVRVTRACICGSDLWPYNSMKPARTGKRMGHEFVGVVEDVGAEVRTVKKGDLVVAPFAWSDGTCAFCARASHLLHPWRLLGRRPSSTAARARPCACRWPTARSSAAGRAADDALMPSLLTLSDVMGTGHHAALAARVARAASSRSWATAPSASAA